MLDIDISIKIIGFSISLCFLLQKILWWSHPLRKDGIPLVPHTIPWIGSGLSLRLSKMIEFMSYWSKQLNSSIFAATIFGKDIIFITDQDVAARVFGGRYPLLTWEHTKTKIFARGLGVSLKAAVDRAKARDGHAIYIKHLMKGDSLTNFMIKYEEVFSQKVFPSLLSRTAKNSDDEGWKDIGIIQLFGAAIFRTTAELFYGDSSLATDHYFDVAWNFNKNFSKLMVQPKFLSSFSKDIADREELMAKMRLIGQLKSSSDSGTKHVKDSYSDLIKEIKCMIDKSESMTEDDRVRFLLSPLWVATINQIPTTFWAVYYLLANHDAYNAVKEEVLAVLEKRSKTKGQSGMTGEGYSTTTPRFSLSELENMRALESLIEETLRLKTTERSLKSRIATGDFVMKLPLNKESKEIHVRKGTLVVTSPTMMHRDGNIFDDPLAFKWNRFLPSEPNGDAPAFSKNSKVIRNPVDAFGSGPTLCPGRRFAKAQMKLIIATVLSEYDLRFATGGLAADGSGVPVIVPHPPRTMNMKKGFSNGIPSEDVVIKVRKQMV